MFIFFYELILTFDVVIVDVIY